ncbi:serine hydrolase FSH [Hypoxylon sp. NC1633]|nr:serine hydrolase FSH [Hypoxylon sp. NC1633]
MNMYVSEADTAYKVLCLHGIGTNSDILEFQTASLRYHLGPSFVFTFVNGAHPWPAAPGIEHSYGLEQAADCFSYYDGSASSAEQAVRDLALYLCENGPFDFILGFSLGAAVAATLLLCPGLDQELRKAQSMVKAAVFICGILPQKWESLQKGILEEIKPEDIPEEMKINISTVHAYSQQDNEFGDQSEMLARMCVKGKMLSILHTAGHDAPKELEEVKALAEAMRLIVS